MNKIFGCFIYIFVGILSGFVYPPFNSAPVKAVPILSLFLVVVLYGIDKATSKKQAFFFPFGLTLLSYLVAFSWITNPFNFVGEGMEYIQNFAWIALVLFAGVLALFMGVVGLITYMADGEKRYFTFAIAVAFCEWVRGWIFTGLPWNPVSIVFSEVPVVIQILSLVGTYGLTFITVFVLTFPYLLMKKQYKSKNMIALLIIVLFVLGFGVLRLYKYREIPTSDIVVRVVDAKVPQDLKYDRNNIYQYISLARRKGWENVDLFVLPETSSGFDLTNNAYYEKVFANINNDKSSLILGFNRYDNIDEEKRDFDIYNSLALLDKNGVKYVYDKNHLVPFGEYIPLKFLVPFKKFTAGVKDFSKGNNREVIVIDGINFLPLICYEVIFSGLRVDDDIEAIVNISNDAWFGDIGKYQHSQLAKYRAIEEGVSVIRVANTGVSSIISPVGEVLSGNRVDYSGEDNLEEAFVSDIMLPKRIERPIFSIIGNWGFILLSIIAFCIVFIGSKPFDFTKKNK